MGCMPGTARFRAVFQMHVVVTQPLTVHGTGSISCRPMGMEPIQFTWTPPVATDASGSEAVDVAPGRYRVRAVDANGDAAEAVVDVEARYEDAVHVRQYRTRHATTSTSRDGSVEALGDGFATPGLRFLWSNGVVTDAPRLSDVPRGTYALVGIRDGEHAPTTIHECAPARVDVRQ
jgi:hypothetical protein